MSHNSQKCQSSYRHLVRPSFRNIPQRREQQVRKFFKSILAPDSYLHSVLPASRDKDIIARLRTVRKFNSYLCMVSLTKHY